MNELTDIGGEKMINQIEFTIRFGAGRRIGDILEVIASIQRSHPNAKIHVEVER